ncbi:BGTF surface domain-containing protein [Halobium salinum]|uniref:BGTF surface domain-containing protein n=2 Tax=Halobium salinum TaxID=1364940 RepID=A0ABD5PDU4_9EURY
MTDTNEKLRSLFLAALMVFSVFAGTVAFAGTSAAANADDWDTEVDVASGADGVGASATVYAGQTLGVQNVDTITDITTDSTLEVRSYDASESTIGGLESTVEVDSDGDVLIDTDDLESGTYVLTTSRSGNEIVTFEVVEQSITAEFDDEEVQQGDSTTVDISSSVRNNYEVYVRADGLDDEELQDIFNRTSVEEIDGEDEVVISDAETPIDANFDGISTGDYNFTFAVVDTTASDEASITVTREGTTSYSLEDSSPTVNSGDTVNMTINLENTDSAVVQIGNAEDVGYQSTVLVETDEETANITLNTFGTAADSPLYGVSAADDDTDVTDIAAISGDDTGASGALEQGNYEVEIYNAGDYQDELDQPEAEQDADDVSPEAVGTLAVADAALESAQTWTTYPDAAEDVGNAQDVLEAVEAGDVVQDGTIAQQDYAVVQIQGSGHFGYLERVEANLTGDQTLLGQLDPDVLSLSIEETNPGPNQDAASVTPEAIYADDETNNVFVVINTQGEDTGRYNATVEAPEDSPLPIEDSSVTAQFRVVDRTAEFESDNLEVAASENSTISGETSIAPGSDVTVRAQSVSGAENPFVESVTTNVTENGTFEAAFNFSGQEVGSNFTVEATASPGFEDDVTADATFVEGQNDTTTADNGTTTVDNGTTTTADNGTTTTADNGTTTTDDGTTTTGDGAGTTTTGDGEGETTGSTPGFGIAVAVIALVAAALLAVRRD